jgi:hypothetical protein
VRDQELPADLVIEHGGRIWAAFRDTLKLLEPVFDLFETLDNRAGQC